MFASRAQLSLLQVSCRAVNAAGIAAADLVHCAAMWHEDIEINIGLARSVTVHGFAAGAATPARL